MQLATPFLIPSATDIVDHTFKKTPGVKTQPESDTTVVTDQAHDQTIPEVVETPDQVAQQNFARLFASCGDCV